MSICRNTTYNLLGSVIPLVASLVTIPIYLGLIGEARYGVLAIAWLLLGYFGLFDLGLGRATAQRIAALRDAPAKERAQTFWTALVLNVGFGVMGGLILWPVATYCFGYMFKIEEALRPEIAAAVPWLALAVPAATLSGVLSGALQGQERFLELNLISVAGTALFQLVPLSVAWIHGPDLGWLLPAALLARLVTLVALLGLCRRSVFLGYPPCFIRSQAGALLRFGGWVTVTAFVGPMMVILDRFVIGVLGGAAAVTYYTVPFQLAERTAIFPDALSSALFPRLAASWKDETYRLVDEALRTLAVVMTTLALLGVLCIGPFLMWWIGWDFANRATRVAQILLLAFWANSFARIPYAQLQAQGQPDRVAQCHLAEVVPYFGLLYLGLSLFGLVGAAVAFSLRVLVDLLLLSALAGSLWRILRTLRIPTLLLGLSLMLVNGISFDRPLAVALVMLLLLTTLVWAWWAAPEGVRGLAKDIPSRYLPRLNSHGE